MPKAGAIGTDLAATDFAGIVIDYLKAEGVRQKAKADNVTLESFVRRPGGFIGAAATFIEGADGPEAALRS